MSITRSKNCDIRPVKSKGVQSQTQRAVDFVIILTAKCNIRKRKEKKTTKAVFVLPQTELQQPFYGPALSSHRWLTTETENNKKNLKCGICVPRAPFARAHAPWVNKRLARASQPRGAGEGAGGGAVESDPCKHGYPYR